MLGLRTRRICIALVFTAFANVGSAVPTQQAASDAEKAVSKQIGKLRSLSDADRAVATKSIALQIRQLPPSMRKIQLADGLANVSTEGDFGRDTLQEVATTLALAVTETPTDKSTADAAYDELAQLAKYEHMSVDVKSPEYRAAQARLDAVDEERKKVDFTLTDIAGKTWTLSSLKGKVVLVNFWATWCPPCRKEMPDLQILADRFKEKGLVILSISDEDATKVNPFIADHKYSWPILLDPGRKVNTLYHVQGIPKSFLYSRGGKLIGQTIDMRTQGQFLALLKTAGLQ